MLGPLLGSGPLWFDSCKRPNAVSDHSVFAFRVVDYGRFDSSLLKFKLEEMHLATGSFRYSQGRTRKKGTLQIKARSVISQKVSASILF